jgi:hypothetical protein
MKVFFLPFFSPLESLHVREHERVILVADHLTVAIDDGGRSIQNHLEVVSRDVPVHLVRLASQRGGNTYAVPE